MKRDSIAPPNLALLRFIRQHQPVGTYDAFSVFEGGGENVKVFSSRLAHLRQAGWLANVGSTYRGIWSLTEKAVALLDHSPDLVPVPVPAPDPDRLDDDRLDDDEEHEPDVIVPPRRIDVMNGPLYCPPAMSYREGALDFEACPSATAGGPMPFRAGHHG